MKAIVDAMKACLRDTGHTPTRVVVARDVWDQAHDSMTDRTSVEVPRPEGMTVLGVPVVVDDQFAPGTVCVMRYVPNPRPRRRVVVTLDLGADSWDEVASALDQIAFEVAAGKMRGSACSGGPSSGYTWSANEDESVTHETYFEALDKYLSHVERLEEKKR